MIAFDEMACYIQKQKQKERENYEQNTTRKEITRVCEESRHK